MTSVLPGDQIWSELQPRLAALHPAEPLIVAQATLGPDEGGPPLSRIVAWAATEPSPHWHFVTCGLSASRFIPGYPDLGGRELSFRLARGGDQRTPPAWVPGFLQLLGRHAFVDESSVAPGAKVELAGLWDAHDTGVTAGIFVDDPAIAGGPIRLVQLVALTPAERSRVDLSSDEKAKLVFELAPVGISDLGRKRRPQPEAPRAAGARPGPPPPPPAPQLATVSVTKVGARMRVSVAAAEAAALAGGLLDAVRAGRLSLQSQGWTLHLNVDDVPRSATWATTLAIYFTLELARQAAAALKDPARANQPLRFEGLPELELLVIGEAAQPQKPSLGARLKGFFGG